MLVDVGHGRDGAAAGPRTHKGSYCGRARSGLGDEGSAAGMHAPERRAGGACAGEATKGARARGGLGGRLGAGRARLRVEQERLVGALGLILGDEDAAVAGELEVDLGQRPVVCGAQREGGAVQRVGLAVGVVEGAGVGVEQVARVRLLGGRVERGRARGMGLRVRVRVRVGAFAAAEELAEHVSYAHAAAMQGSLSSCWGSGSRGPGEQRGGASGVDSPWQRAVWLCGAVRCGRVAGRASKGCDAVAAESTRRRLLVWGSCAGRSTSSVARGAGEAWAAMSRARDGRWSSEGRGVPG